MANGSFRFSATSKDMQMSIDKATSAARQKHGSGRVVSQNFVRDPQTGVYTGTIVYEPTPQEEKDAILDEVMQRLLKQEVDGRVQSGQITQAGADSVKAKIPGIVAKRGLKTASPPTRPSAPIRERRASEDPLTDAISDDSDDAIDLAGLEPPTGTQRSAPQDRTVSRDSAMSGMPTQSTTVRQDDELTKRLVGDNFEEQGPQPTGTDVLNVRTDRDRSRFSMPASVVNDMSQNTSLSQPVLNYLQNEADFQVAAGRENLIPGTAGMILSEKEKEQRLEDLKTQPLFMEQGRATEIIGDDEQARDLKRGLPTRERDITDPDMTDDTVTADAEEVELDLEGMAPPQTLLQRIGNALKNNPELAASGAQLLGGLISNAAQNRAQRRADRTTDQRVARANLISAITGGRARPTVERAQADTGGFMSLDTLGKALQGGGAAVKGELARQVEEAERERKAGLDERAASVAEQRAETQEQSRIDTDAYRDRLLTLQERGLRADYLKSLRSGQPKETPDKQTRNEYKAMSRILRQVDNVENLLRDTDFFQAGSGLKLLQIAGLDEGLPQFMGGEKTRELKAAVNSLVQTLGEGLSGVLSDRDIEFLRQQAIKENDSLDTAMLKAQQIRNRLSQNIRENFEIDSQYFNMEPYRDLVDLVEASGEQGEGSFVSDLSGAKLNMD